jgi:hypothetical protein
MIRRSFPVALAMFLPAGTATAGPISVFTAVQSAGGSGNDEIPVSGLGSWAVLTTGGGVDPVVTVLADQNSARQAVVGYWPVMGFRDTAQYEAQRGTVVTVPATPVTLYTEVWNGAYGGVGVDHQTVLVHATVSAQVSATTGQNAVDWQFVALPTQATFGDGTVVSINYDAVRQPDGVPQIEFQDGSPTIGFPGPVYYPTLVEAEVDVTRPPTNPGNGTGSGGPTTPPGGGVTAATPEPGSGVLLAGFALGGLVVRRRTGRF